MNAYSKFSELKPKLYPLEEQRKNLLQKLQNQLFLGVALFLAGAAFLYAVLIPLAIEAGLADVGFFGYFLWGFLLYALFSYLRANSLKQYQETVKNSVLTELISSADPNLSYKPTSCVAENDFEKSGLFDESVSKYNGEDLISGERNGCSFRLSELEVDEGTSKHPNIFFHGIFMIIDLAETVHGQTFILPANYKESLGSKISKKLWSGGRSGEPVDIMDEEFNEIFKVISDDPISTQQLLNPSFRKILIELEEQFDCDLRLCLKEQQLYLAIATWEDMFAISHKENLLNSALVQDSEEDLNLLLQAVDVLSTKEQKEVH